MVFDKILGFFGKKKQKRAEVSFDEHVKVKSAFEKVKAEMEQLRKEAEEVSLRLAGHNNMMKEHEKEIKKQSEDIMQHYTKLSDHAEKISNLELAVKERLSAAHEVSQTSKRLVHREAQLVASKLANGQSTNEIIWDTFTPQEKRIIGTFLENKDLPLSYEDVGKVLSKAPSTIKNQMKNIELKAKIFEENRDNEQRKRFSLKSGLRINKSLD